MSFSDLRPGYLTPRLWQEFTEEDTAIHVARALWRSPWVDSETVPFPLYVSWSLGLPMGAPEDKNDFGRAQETDLRERLAVQFEEYDPVSGVGDYAWIDIDRRSESYRGRNLCYRVIDEDKRATKITGFLYDWVEDADLRGIMWELQGRMPTEEELCRSRTSPHREPREPWGRF